MVNRKLLVTLGWVLPILATLLIVAAFLVGGGALVLIGIVIGGAGIALQVLFKNPGDA